MRPITHLFIAGPRDASRQMRDYIRRAVRRAQFRGYTIVVGDAPRGIDRAVIAECQRREVPFVVAGTGNVPRCGRFRRGRYVKVHRETYRGMGGVPLAGRAVRDRWLADNAQIGLFLWDGQDDAPKAAYDYMISRGRQAHLIRFSAEVGA